MRRSQKDDLQEFISYYVSLIMDKNKLRLIWGQYPADYWLEDLVEFWEEYKLKKPARSDIFEKIDKFVREVDALLDDLENAEEIDSNIAHYIFSHPKWEEIERCASRCRKEKYKSAIQPFSNYDQVG